jgi:2-polyprenyl-3-methyl-5-hydroxy-6-metoxy-1,4-benzoquinol methylase
MRARVDRSCASIQLYSVAMASPSWNDNYAQGFCPWDAGVPDPLLVEAIECGGVAVGRALDVGCGTGTNAIWLAQHGYGVLGVDIAPLAIDQARAKLPARTACRSARRDAASGRGVRSRRRLARMRARCACAAQARR